MDWLALCYACPLLMQTTLLKLKALFKYSNMTQYGKVLALLWFLTVSAAGHRAVEHFLVVRSRIQSSEACLL